MKSGRNSANLNMRWRYLEICVRCSLPYKNQSCIWNCFLKIRRVSQVSKLISNRMSAKRPSVTKTSTANYNYLTYPKRVFGYRIEKLYYRSLLINLREKCSDKNAPCRATSSIKNGVRTSFRHAWKCPKIDSFVDWSFANRSTKFWINSVLSV